MPTVALVKTTWSGTTGGPGLTVHAVQNSSNTELTGAQVQLAVNRLRTWWSSLFAGVPNEVTITVQPTADQYEVGTGVLTGSATAATPPATVTGSVSTGYAGGVGYRVDWNTTVIVDGRRFRGRTYIVPAAASIFDTDGTLTSAHFSAVSTACTTLLSGLVTDGLKLVVWRRGSIDHGITGVAHQALTGTVADKSAVLRSRRD